MLRNSLISIILFLSFSAMAISAEKYILANGKKSEYRIAIDKNASESEKWAADELQRWLREITGADLPVQDINVSHKGPQIVIGHNSIMQQKTGIAPAWSTQNEEAMNEYDGTITSSPGRTPLAPIAAISADVAELKETACLT